jgi:hypothetical protein
VWPRYQIVLVLVVVLVLETSRRSVFDLSLAELPWTRKPRGRSMPLEAEDEDDDEYEDE